VLDVFRGYDEPDGEPSPVVDVHKILKSWSVLVRAVVKAAAEAAEEAVVKSVDDLTDIRRRRRRQANNAAVAVKVEKHGSTCGAPEAPPQATEVANATDEGRRGDFKVAPQATEEANATDKAWSGAPEVAPQATEEANTTGEGRSEAPKATPQAMEETDVTDEVPEATPQAMEEFACDEPSPLSLLASEALLMPTFIIDCVGTFLRCVWCAVLSVVLWVSNLP
jgi:hypothetical protein